MAFVLGLPTINLDPELVLIVFLPPLLMDCAYFSVWDEFKRNLGGILLLAIGAVAFTTLAVGLVVHWVVPSLPWSACFALGAIVSPPDAIAAKAVLERVRKWRSSQANDHKERHVHFFSNPRDRYRSHSRPRRIPR
ncbi:NhaP-type Na+/H+ or K+/H+ antiporter [Paraburkholderia sp. GAS348]